MNNIIEITDHELVPKFRVLTKDEKTGLLERLKVSDHNLPKILSSDPMIGKLKLKNGEVLEISRKSQTAGDSLYYRIVVGQ